MGLTFDRASLDGRSSLLIVILGLEGCALVAGPAPQRSPQLADMVRQATLPISVHLGH